MRLSKNHFKKVPWYLKPFLWNQKRKYGQYLEPAKIWASVPRLFLSVASIYGALERKRSPVPPIVRSLVSIRVSQMNWCSFCVDLNSLTIMKRINNREKVDALEHWRESKEYLDNPATLSRVHGKYSHEKLRLKKENDTHFSFTFLPGNENSATITFKNVDVSLMTPSLPTCAKNNPDLTRISLTDRQWNRQQVAFEPNSPYVEITGGDGFEKIISITRNLPKTV